MKAPPLMITDSLTLGSMLPTAYARLARRFPPRRIAQVPLLIISVQSEWQDTCALSVAATIGTYPALMVKGTVTELLNVQFIPSPKVTLLYPQ